MRITTSYLIGRMTGLRQGEVVKVVDTSPAQYWAWDGRAFVDTGIGATAPAPVPVYALRDLSTTNRYLTAAGGGEQGIVGSFGVMEAIVVRTATGADAYYASCGGVFSGQNAGWVNLQGDRNRNGYVYDASTLYGIPTALIGDQANGKVALFCWNKISGGAVRAHVGRTLIGDSAASFTYAPPSPTLPDYVGPRGGGAADRLDYVARASFSGTLTTANWCAIAAYFEQNGEFPADLTPYGVTARHWMSVKQDSLLGTTVPTTLVDNVGGTNWTKSGSPTVVTYPTPSYDWGNGASVTLAAFGDSLTQGTGLSASLPGGFPNSAAQVGKLWEYSRANNVWSQLLYLSDRVSCQGGLAYAANQLTGRYYGISDYGVSGTFADTNWANDVGGHRTAFISYLIAAVTKNPQTRLIFETSLGSNDALNVSPSNWATSITTTMAAVISALVAAEATTGYVVPSSIPLVYYILPPGNLAGSPGHASVYASMVAMNGTTTTISGKSVRWIGVPKSDANMAPDNIHPLTAGYVGEWGVAGAAALNALGLL